MSGILGKTLKDGSHLEICCLHFPGETQVPEWMKTRTRLYMKEKRNEL